MTQTHTKEQFKTIGAVAALVVLAFLALFIYNKTSVDNAETDTGNATAVEYACTEGGISAVYGDNTVGLKLSDGRTFILPQVMSGSGIRYEQDGIVFAGKGPDAFLTENETMTYSNCVQAQRVESDDKIETSFTDASGTFAFSYPSELTISGGGIGFTDAWRVDSTAPGLIKAVVTIPKQSQPNTNFSDAKFTIGTSNDNKEVMNCMKGDAAGNMLSQSKVNINGVDFAKFTMGDAGAGNYYETTSYRTLHNNTCFAIEYTIHSTNIGAYTPDQGISEFNKSQVISVLEGMAQSFRFTDTGVADNAARIKIFGQLVCLPHIDKNGPQTRECAIGVQVAGNPIYYALDMSAVPDNQAIRQTGETVKIIGMNQAKKDIPENLKKYDIRGLVKVTTIEKYPN